MASVWTETHTAKDGNVTWRVKWRENGRKCGPRTMPTPELAGEFERLIREFGALPEDDVLRSRGFGWLLADEAPVDDEGPKRLTFREYAPTVLRQRHRGSEKWLQDKLIALDDHVLPHFGDDFVDSIPPKVIHDWQQSLLRNGRLVAEMRAQQTGRKHRKRRKGEGDGLEAKSINTYRASLVSPVFEAACRMQFDGSDPVRTSGNPCKDVPTLKESKKYVERLRSHVEAQLFVECLYAENANFADLVLTNLATGFRWGEITAVPECAVIVGNDIVAGIEVRQVWATGTERQPGTNSKRYLKEAAKSDEGTFRFMPVHPAVMKGVVLPRLAGSPNRLIFAGPLGDPWAYATYWKRWNNVMERMRTRGVSKRLTSKSLRHGLLSWLGEEDVDILTLKESAGHADIATTSRYMRGSGRKRQVIIDAVDRFLYGKTNTVDPDERPNMGRAA